MHLRDSLLYGMKPRARGPDTFDSRDMTPVHRTLPETTAEKQETMTLLAKSLGNARVSSTFIVNANANTSLSS